MAYKGVVRCYLVNRKTLLWNGEEDMNRKLCILGSTGSIGTQTLQVVDNNRDVLSVEAMTAGDNIDLFAEQILRYQPRMVAVKT